MFPVIGYCYPCIDINFTPYAGAENLFFLHTGLEKINDLIDPLPVVTIKDILNPTQCPSLSVKDHWLRKAKSIFLWIPANCACLVTQHEIFGHGYRIRDLGTEYAKVTGYKMYVFGGETSFKITNQLTTTQRISMAIAGIEADVILANKIRLKWLNNGQANGTESMLYFMSSLTLTGYAFSVSSNPKSVPQNENDISNFLFYLNNTYQESYLGYEKVRNVSLLNFIDPFIYYSIISQWMYDAYCLPIKIPMFNIGSIKYLPSARVALTPFGLQGYLENFFLINSIPTYLYLKWGKNGPNNYWGVGVENQKVFNWKQGSLGFRMDLWQQPHVLFEQGALSVLEIMNLPKESKIPPLYPTSVLNAKSLGIAFSLIGAYGFAKWPVRLFSELGYKSDGYLPGEALRKSPIARGGVSGQF